MFSSSLLTAETPSPSQAQAGSAKTGPDRLAEGGPVANEETGAFAKEFQAVVSDEQKVTQSQLSAPETLDEARHTALSGADAETEGQLVVPEAASTEEHPTNITKQDGAELNSSLINNTESDVAISTDLTAGQPSAQTPGSQNSDSPPEADPVNKQQIMTDGEALLSRLSESSKQLAASQEPVQEGNKLPSGPTVAAVATAAAKPAQTESLAGPLSHGQQQALPLQPQPEQAEQPATDTVAASPQPAFIANNLEPDNAEAGVNGKNEGTIAAGEGGSLSLAQAELEQGSLSVAAGTDTPAEPQPAGISQEELAKVFAAPQAQAKPSDAGDAESTNSLDGSDHDTAVMAVPLASGASVSPTVSEVKGSQSASLQSGELPQSPASPRAADIVKEQRVSAELASADLASADLAASERLVGKSKAGNVFTPTAVATAMAANNSNSQPLLAETQQAVATGVGNPALSLAPSAVPPGSVAPNAGTVEAQLAGAAGIAAGAGAVMTALKRGAADNGADAKSAEVAHSLSGLSTQQGAVTAQARAEAALVQSPLQLSKEQAGDQLAERMQMMMSKNLKHVDIRLDPPELGKLQIKLSLNQDQASVQFTVGNQQTRDLVEQAMPRLRELLNQQGLQLAQSTVQQDSSRQQFAGQPNQQHQGQQAGSGSQQNSGSSHEQDAGPGSAEPAEMYVSQATDRVDYYA